MTFHYTDWLIGILTMAYDHLHIHGGSLISYITQPTRGIGHCSCRADHTSVTNTAKTKVISAWHPAQWQDSIGIVQSQKHQRLLLDVSKRLKIPVTLGIVRYHDHNYERLKFLSCCAQHGVFASLDHSSIPRWWSFSTTCAIYFSMSITSV